MKFIKTIIGFLIVLLILFTACKQKQETTAPAVPPTEVKIPVLDSDNVKAEYSALTKAAETSSYSAKYKVTLSGNKGTAENDLIINRKGKETKTIMSLSAANKSLSMITIVNSEGMFVCGKNETSSDYECNAVVTSDKSDFVDKIKAQNDALMSQLKVSKLDPKTFAGQEGICFLIEGVGALKSVATSQQCYSKDGVLVYNKQSDKAGNEAEIKLAEFNKDISGVDFSIPGKIVAQQETY